MTVCPKCKGKSFRKGKLLPGVVSNHIRCTDCDTVLFVQVSGPFSEHGWCGSPKEHWAEPDPPKTLIEQLQERAKEKVTPKGNDIPF